jgi:membrane protease YdiL (CAAX protease family)
MTSVEPLPPFSRARVRTLVWALAVWFVVMIVMAALGASVTLAATSVYVVLFGWIWWQCGRAGVSVRAFVQPAPANEWRQVWLVLPTLLVSLAFIGIVVGVFHFSPTALRDPDMERAIRRGPTSIVALVTAFAMVVVAPIAEELVFRGVILRRWTHKWGFGRAALASSAAFAILHLDPPGAFLFALVMVHLYTRSGTLLVPMTAHALNNAIVVASIYAGGRSNAAEARPTAPPNLDHALPGLIVMGVLGLGILLLYFRRQPRLSEWRLPPLATASTPAQ